MCEYVLPTFQILPKSCAAIFFPSQFHTSFRYDAVIGEVNITLSFTATYMLRVCMCVSHCVCVCVARVYW